MPNNWNITYIYVLNQLEYAIIAKLNLIKKEDLFNDDICDTTQNMYLKNG